MSILEIIIYSIILTALLGFLTYKIIHMILKKKNPNKYKDDDDNDD